MPTMQTADVLVNLGGDARNSVPKYGVTAAEIAVLATIHGDDAVHDIKPRDDVERSSKDEHARLLKAYGQARDGEGASLFDQVYPGRNPVLHTTLADLELDEQLYAATDREKPKAKNKAKAAAKPKDENSVLD